MPRPKLAVLKGPPDELLSHERLMSYIQEQAEADFPDLSPEAAAQRYHTGRVPNGTKGRNRPKLMLMGQRRYASQALLLVPIANSVCRSGKSSISGVVFQKMPPSETLYLETTTRPEESSSQ